MRISLVGQPYAAAPSLHRFLASGCADPRYSTLRFATAWAKQSGLARVEDDFRAFRDRGGEIVAVVGISEGGATRQGLHLVHALCDTSYVFHDAGRTFHPKLYFFSGADHWALFIGSNNLTAGGIFRNYEAAVEASGSFASADDRAFLSQITDYFDGLVGDSDVCRRLDPDLITLLIESPEHRIGDELRMAGRRAGTGAGPEGARIFGRSRHPKATDPKRPTGARGAQAPDQDRGPAEPADGSAVPEDAPALPSELLTHTWSKKLSASDAQRPPGSASKTTGNLKLAKAGHPIDQKTYFREVFFGDAEWTPRQMRRGVQEKATVRFEVFEGTTPLGTHELVVDHAPYRIAGQDNVPTWLHWGEHLTAYLKTHDHVGAHVTLESFEDGSRRLTFSPTPIGEVRVPPADG